MQILHRFSGTIQRYSEELSDPDRYRPDHCPQCEAHRPLRAHGFYTRTRWTFYYLCSILDGCSRYIVNWDLRESMTEADIEVILERAKEHHTEARPRIISGNRPQFIAEGLKEFLRIPGVTHVRTSPYYPQSNGKIERWQCQSVWGANQKRGLNVYHRNGN
jgi:transposase InsO family protein